MTDKQRETRAGLHVVKQTVTQKSENINQDNDWAAAPPVIDEAEKLLCKTYYRQLAEIQIAIHHDRNTRMKSKIQRYFNSSPIKNTLARVLYLSEVDKQLVSVSVVAEKLFTSRQTALGMLNDCVAEGWAYCDEGSPKRYAATRELVNAFELYANFQLQRVEDSGMYEAHSALSNYRALADKLLNK